MIAHLVYRRTRNDILLIMPTLKMTVHPHTGFLLLEKATEQFIFIHPLCKATWPSMSHRADGNSNQAAYDWWSCLKTHRGQHSSIKHTAIYTTEIRNIHDNMKAWNVHLKLVNRAKKALWVDRWIIQSNMVYSLSHHIPLAIELHSPSPTVAESVSYVTTTEVP